MAVITNSVATFGTSIKSGSLTEVSDVYTRYGEAKKATGENKKTYFFNIKAGGQYYRSIDYAILADAESARTTALGDI